MAEPDDDDLPIATPIPPATPTEPVKPVRAGRPVEPKPRRREAMPAERETDHKPPRARTFMACGVLGCLVICVLAAVGFVTFAAIMLLGQVGNELADRTNEPPPPTKSMRADRPGPVLQTKLAADTTVELPGPITAVCRGANGRFLLMQVKTPTENQILVFDPNEGKLLDPLVFSPSEPAPVFAAGATKLFVYRSGRIERYNLTSREAPEATAPFNLPVQALAAGAGADDLLYAFTLQPPGMRVWVLDGETLTDRGFEFKVDRPVGKNSARTSANGRLVGLSGATSLPGALIPGAAGRGQFFTFNGSVITSKQFAVTDVPGHVAPSPDGQWLYTSRGVFKPDGKPVLTKKVGYLYTLPAAQGSDLFLSQYAPNATVQLKLNLHSFRASDPAAGVHLETVDGPTPLPADDMTTSIPADLRTHFWPAAGLVAVLPPVDLRGNQPPLRLYKIKVGELLTELPGHEKYVYIATDPPVYATRGEKWTYPLFAWSSSAVVKYRLTSAPVGMTSTDMDNNAGQVTWTVPADFQPTEAEVVIEAKAGDEKTTQKFTLTIVDPHNP